MQTFENTIAPFLPVRMRRGAAFVGHKALYKLPSGRVVSAWFDNAPHKIACMGVGDCLWLKVVNPSGTEPGEIRVDVTSIPFSDFPALKGRSVDTQTGAWNYCAPPTAAALEPIRDAIGKYLEIWE